MNTETDNELVDDAPGFDPRRLSHSTAAGSQAKPAKKSKPAKKPKRKRIVLRIITAPEEQRENRTADEAQRSKTKTSTSREWTSEMRDVAELKPHRLQEDLPATTDDEDAKFREDLRANGQLKPIEILSDGTIICGHRRWAAARSLGWEQVRVIVRDDLESQGASAIGFRFYEDNRSHRHFSTLQLARLAFHILQLSAKGKKRRGQGRLRDELSRQLGRSGRQLERLLPLAEAPAAIYRAVDHGELSQGKALRFLEELDSDEIESAVERIEGGESAKEVVEELLPQQAKKRASTIRPENLHGALAVCKQCLKTADLKDVLKAIKEDKDLGRLVGDVTQLLQEVNSQLPQKQTRPSLDQKRRKTRRKPR